MAGEDLDKDGVIVGLLKGPLIRYAGSAGRNLDWYKAAWQWTQPKDAEESRQCQLKRRTVSGSTKNTSPRSRRCNS